MTFRERNKRIWIPATGDRLTLRYANILRRSSNFSIARKWRISLIFLQLAKPTLGHSFSRKYGSSTVIRVNQPVSRIVRPYLSTSFSASPPIFCRSISVSWVFPMPPIKVVTFVFGTQVKWCATHHRKQSSLNHCYLVLSTFRKYVQRHLLISNWNNLNPSSRHRGRFVHEKYYPESRNLIYTNIFCILFI